MESIPIKTRSYKTTRGKHGQYTFWHKLQQYFFFDPCLRVLKIKTKLNKWDLFKSKNFLAAKEMLNKTKRQASE